MTTKTIHGIELGPNLSNFLELKLEKAFAYWHTVPAEQRPAEFKRLELMLSMVQVEIIDAVVEAKKGKSQC